MSKKRKNQGNNQDGASAQQPAAKQAAPAIRKPPAPQRSAPRRDLTQLWPWLWFLTSMVVFAAMPGLHSSNYMPKALWATCALTLGFFVCPPRRRDEAILTPLGALWLAYLAWAFASLAWAPTPRVGFERLLAHLLPTAAYLLARRIRFWESEALWTALCALVGVVAAIGCLQYAFSSLPLIHWFPGTAIPRATLGHRNYASLYIMVTVPFIAWRFFRARGWRSALALACLGLVLLFLLLARTRGAWVGTIAGAVFVAASGVHHKFALHPRKTFAVFAPLLLAIPLLFVLKPTPEIENALGEKADITEASKNLLDPSTRVDMWRSSIGLTNPILGAGFGNFPVVATPFVKRQQVKALNWEVHNDYLQAFVDLGAPGLILFTLVFLTLMRLGWLGRRDSLVLAAGAVATALTVMQFTTFTSETVSTQIWMGGVAAILNSQATVRPWRRRRLAPGVALLGSYLFAAGLLAYAVAIGYTIRGDRAFQKAQSPAQQALGAKRFIENADRHKPEQVAEAKRQYPAIYKSAEDALRRLAFDILPTIPLDANMVHTNCHEYAKLCMLIEAFDCAAVFARKAVSLHPNDRVSLAFVIHAAKREKKPEEERKLLEFCIETFGYDPSAVFPGHMARYYYEHGEQDKAREVVERTRQNRVDMPAHPSPATGARDVALDAKLDWSDCNAAESYEVYFWHEGESEPETPTFRGLRQSEAVPEGLLRPGVAHFWRIKAVGRYEDKRTDILYFHTRKSAP